MRAEPKSWRNGEAASIVLVGVFAVAFAAMRGIALLGPPGLRWLLPLSFVIMMALPWFLLRRRGRRRIGLQRPKNRRYYLAGVLLGALAAVVCFAIGIALFGHTANNWYVSVASNYRNTLDTTGFSAVRLHLTFTIPAMIFSPVGEEIFFRGIFQHALEIRLNAKASALIECAVFGGVHLFHHGLSRSASGITLLPVSGILWVILMFAIALTFAWLTKRSESLFPAMASHASFNLFMNVTIFAMIWQHVG